MATQTEIDSTWFERFIVPLVPVAVEPAHGRQAPGPQQGAASGTAPPQQTMQELDAIPTKAPPTQPHPASWATGARPKGPPLATSHGRDAPPAKAPPAGHTAAQGKAPPIGFTAAPAKPPPKAPPGSGSGAAAPSSGVGHHDHHHHHFYIVAGDCEEVNGRYWAHYAGLTAAEIREGWVSYYDVTFHQLYFHNTWQHITTWTPPSADPSGTGGA